MALPVQFLVGIALGATGVVYYQKNKKLQAAAKRGVKFVKASLEDGKNAVLNAAAAFKNGDETQASQAQTQEVQTQETQEQK
ncbi:MAG: hypothetical protein ACTTIC_08045 [Helicobacteraceae bacterium]